METKGLSLQQIQDKLNGRWLIQEMILRKQIIELLEICFEFIKNQRQ